MTQERDHATLTANRPLCTFVGFRRNNFYEFRRADWGAVVGGLLLSYASVNKGSWEE